LVKCRVGNRLLADALVSRQTLVIKLGRQPRTGRRCICGRCALIFVCIVA